MIKKKLASMFTFFISLAVINLFIGCSHGQESDVEQILLSPLDKKNVDKADKEIELAIASKDFRLYATSGRRVTLPGINNDELAYVKDFCGMKYLTNTGDVITSEQQRAERKNSIAYMALYNQKMLILCLKN